MKKLDAADWDDRYRRGDTPWDLSGPTPEFERLRQENYFPRRGRAMVPGGGRGYDAILLAEAGLEVDLVDFSPLALGAAQELAWEKKAHLSCFRHDFFTLPESAYHRESYQLILEYTFFCAIDPALRSQYARVAHALLAQGGVLVALFFPLSTDRPGPPFPVSRAEIEELFSPYFGLEFMEPKCSVKPRAGKEILGIFRKK